MHANEPGADRADAVPDDAQRRFDELLAHLPAGVVMHDAGGRVVSANPQALALLGRTAEDLRGAPGVEASWQFVRADGTVMPASEYPVNEVLRTGAKVSDLDDATLRKWQTIAKGNAWKDYAAKSETCAKLLAAAEKLL